MCEAVFRRPSAEHNQPPVDPNTEEDKYPLAILKVKKWAVKLDQMDQLQAMAQLEVTMAQMMKKFLLRVRARVRVSPIALIWALMGLSGVVSLRRLRPF